MSELTLESVQAKYTELGKMIQQLALQAQETTLRVPAAAVMLRPGEWYAGAVLNEDGTVKHHTIVSAVHDGKLSFDAAQRWAQDSGLSAPSIQESRFITAHRYARLADMAWFWTCEPHENEAYAWNCTLYNGTVDSYNRSSLGGAVAVRRFIP